MTAFAKFDRYITGIFFLTVVTLIATSYFAFKAVLGVHYKQQQEIMLPLYSLVTTEIVRPLIASHYMANDEFLIDHIEQDSVDKKKLLTYLKRLSDEYAMLTFIAIDKHNFTLDSRNQVHSLNAEDTEWYHRLKVQNKDQFADIGNSEDPHLYFDVKMYSADKFIGFAGVGLDLNYFADTFAKLKQQYGFNLYFVDENNEVTLSSDAIMKTESHHRREQIVNLNELGWFQHYQKQTDKSQGIVIDTGSESLSVSVLPVKELNWQVYITAPPASEQNAYWQIFFSRFSIFVVVATILYWLFLKSLKSYQKRLVADAEIDFLTKLPNRTYINWWFDSIKTEHKSLSIVMADIDHFKSINDTHGHLIGDDVLKSVAETLSTNVRKMDIVGRWGGEEFILLFPDTAIDQVIEVTERIRHNIEQLPFKNKLNNQSFSTTVSFGVSHGNLANTDIESLIENADNALYQAKNTGRNQVICQPSVD